MSAKLNTRYLLRFDDICPTMNWRVWEQVERVLDRQEVAPIMAVVPDNSDSALQVAPAREDFWDRVRGWQERGWTIGLHGYDHRYVTREAGVVGLKQRSEFAGLSPDAQLAKLRAGVAILREHGVTARIWVAPGHSFDRETLRALDAIGLGTISDGFFMRAVRDEDGRIWIPQQLWRFRRMLFGTWTVCHHINSWNDSDVARFESALVEYRGSIARVDDILASDIPAMSVLDRMVHQSYRAVLRLRNRRMRISGS